MPSVADPNKIQAGQTSYLKGVAAEQTVAQLYLRRGCKLIKQRYRGRGGEIDLIMQDGDFVVFVEVKASSNHAKAAERLTLRQMQRIWRSAEEFLETQPKGQLTDARFDVALVNREGVCEILENVFTA